MADPTMTLLEYLRKVGVDLEGDFLSQGTQLLAQLAIEFEAEQQIGAGRYERSPERTTYRNGHRERVWETRVGEIPLRIPKLREGSYLPSLLEPRRRAEKALLAVVQAAYVQGVSTRKVDELLQALGLTGIDKSKVSRICRELDVFVDAFRNRPLEGSYPYLWLDALYLKVRQDHRIVSQALVVAIAVRDTGDREILGVSLGQSEEYAFWLDFLRGLARRGLKGVQLVTSDAHEGLKAAVEQVLAGSTWQRCRVHFMRNVLAHIPKGSKSVVAAALRTIFAQPDRAAATQQLREVVKAMASRWPRGADVVARAEEDVLAYMAFPVEHWTRIYSTNPLERLNEEVKRRTNVVGVFPDEASVLRLVGSVLIEVWDDWQVGRRYFSQESMRRLSEPEALLVVEPQPLTLAPVK
ncbi:MAG TPA: IS256 family transposase [Anaerolineales bacterium]|nr:IS256 family transposase [Anaerolineales bacterium]